MDLLVLLLIRLNRRGWWVRAGKLVVAYSMNRIRSHSRLHGLLDLLAWLLEILWLTWLLDQHRLRLLSAHISQLRRGRSCGLREQHPVDLTLEIANLQILLLKLKLVLGFEIPISLVKFS